MGISWVSRRLAVLEPMGLAKDCHLPRSEMKEQVEKSCVWIYTAVIMSEAILRIQAETETVRCFWEWWRLLPKDLGYTVIIQAFDFSGGHTDYGVQTTATNSLDQAHSCWRLYQWRSTMQK